MSVLGILNTHYSLGRSTFTAEKSKGKLSYPISVIDLALEHKLDKLVIVDSTISGAIELSQNCAAAKIKLIYGLKVVVCQDINEKSESSLKTEAKYIIFVKNNQGYKDLIRISTALNITGFYYRGRIDFKTLKKYWNDKNLSLAVPFYDSFLHLNTLESHLHVPDFSFARPTFFIEDNNLPFDYLIEKRVREYATVNKYETLPAQSIFYYDRQDFISYLCLRCINNRSSLERPELNGMSSDSFNFLRWKELNSVSKV